MFLLGYWAVDLALAIALVSQWVCAAIACAKWQVEAQSS